MTVPWEGLWPAFEGIPPPVLRYGKNAAVEGEGAGLRFRNILIPQGASINTAILRFTAFTDRATTPRLYFSAELEDNPGDFSGDDYGSFTIRFLNHTARIDQYNLTHWLDTVEYDSPELRAVVQEIVNRPGWVSGNAMVFFVEDFDERTLLPGQIKQYYPHNIDNARAVKLNITYIP